MTAIALKDATMRIQRLAFLAVGAAIVVGTWACGDETIPGPTVVKTDTLRLTVHDTVHDTVTVTHYDTVHIQSTVLDTVFLDTFPSPTIMMENFRVGQRLVMSVDFLDSGPSIVDTLDGPSYQNPNPNPPTFPYVFTARCVTIPAGRTVSNFFLYSPDDRGYPNGYEMFANSGRWQGAWVVQTIVTTDTHYLYAFPSQTACKA